MTRQAKCHCGNLVLQCAGEPFKVSLCHCFECQRRTGSSFSIAAFFLQANVKVISGIEKAFSRTSASGFAVTFHFCPECGSNLWWKPERLPNAIGIAVGSFADRCFPKPEQAVWAEERQLWLELPSGLPTHARNPIAAAKGK